MAVFMTGLVPKKISKKRKPSDGSRKLVQPIPLDSSGRPVFPIVLGGLTVYSLGEVRVWSHLNDSLSVWNTTTCSQVVDFYSDHHRQNVVPR